MTQNLRSLINFAFWICFAGFVSMTWIHQVMQNWDQDEIIKANKIERQKAWKENRELIDQNTQIIARNSFLIGDLLKRTEDRWTGEDQQRWAEECLRLNPNVKFPEAKFWPRKVVPKFD